MKIEAIMIMTPKLRKDLHAAFLKRKRISPIKRTRKSGHNGGTAKLESLRGGRDDERRKESIR